MALLDFLFPRRCLGCSKSGRYFCPACQQAIKPIVSQICPVCQKPAIAGKTHFRCQGKYSPDGLISVFAYKGLIKEAITKLKYRFATDLAEELVALAASQLRLDTFSTSYVIDDTFTLIPVPLHSRRKRWRGFNQSEVLGQLLAKKFGWKFESEILKRTRYTSPQVDLKKEDRARNVKGAFFLNPNYKLFIADYKFFLFDDVWTTGSTIRECANVLKRAGAQKVWGLTLAR